MTSTTKRTSPSATSICWQVNTWTFTSCRNTLFLSDFIGIPGIGEKAFRFGAETDAKGELVKLCCYVNFVELARLGFATREVTCILKEKGSNHHGELRTLKCVDGADVTRAFFLHAAPVKTYYYSGTVVTNYKNPCLTFRLVLSGTAEQYAPCRFDARLGQELWTAAVTGQMTDVVFQVGDSKFPAHKFILAARSPVFRAMFDTDMVESRTGEVQIVDVEDLGIFEQFLRFIYTGQLDKPLSKQLGMLADKYQVATLSNLGQAYSYMESAKLDGLMDIIAAPKELSKGLGSNDLSLQLCESEPLKVDSLHTEIFPTADEDNHCNKVASSALNKCLRYRVNANGVSRAPQDTSRSYEVKLYCNTVNALAWRIAAAELVADVAERERNHHFEHPMETIIPLEYCDGQPLQVFRSKFDHRTDSSSSVQPPLIRSLRFAVHFLSTVETYECHMRDTLVAQELWSSRINKERTDVEFRVGDITFPAHRALLAALCPALAALVPAESSSSSPGIVSIPDVDPVIFEDVLYFLYTGSIRENQIQIENLEEVAAAYKIETLYSIALANKRQREVDQGVLSEVLMATF